MQFRFIGSGDAFGSGGRFNTCFHITGDETNFLIDCGASSVVALKRAETCLNDIRTILITHFHADHFGGLPAFMLDAQFFSKRTQPLTIAGPHELNAWFVRVMETAFPGSSKTQPKFELKLLELCEKETVDVDGLRVTPYLVKHGNPGGPFFAYRIEVEGRTIAYSGDTNGRTRSSRLAGTLTCSSQRLTSGTSQSPLHLDLATLETYLPEINPKRLILTHMSDDMLAKRGEVDYEFAEDGMTVTV